MLRVFCFVFCGAGNESRVLDVLGKHSATELHLQPVTIFSSLRRRPHNVAHAGLKLPVSSHAPVSASQMLVLQLWAPASSFSYTFTLLLLVDWKPHEVRGSLFDGCPEQYPAQRRCSVNVCWLSGVLLCRPTLCLEKGSSTHTHTHTPETLLAQRISSLLQGDIPRSGLSSPGPYLAHW
jgi:hypothetical protein